MTTSTGGTRWQQLGDLLIRRRADLDPRFGGIHGRQMFCDTAGLSYRLVYDIEEARRSNFGKAARGALENGYQLEPGAISRFIAGASLEVRAGFAPGRAVRKSGPSAAASDDRSVQWVRRILAIAEAHYGPGFTGEQAFPGSRAMAETWDDPDIPMASKLRLLAIFGADEAARSDTGLWPLRAGSQRYRTDGTLCNELVTMRSTFWNIRTGRTHNAILDHTPSTVG